MYMHTQTKYSLLFIESIQHTIRKGVNWGPSSVVILCPKHTIRLHGKQYDEQTCRLWPTQYRCQISFHEKRSKSNSAFALCWKYLFISAIFHEPWYYSVLYRINEWVVCGLGVWFVLLVGYWDGILVVIWVVVVVFVLFFNPEWSHTHTNSPHWEPCILHYRMFSDQQENCMAALI